MSEFEFSVGTTGNNNTATGHSSLFSNTTGFYNAATGAQALYSNTSGYYNTADAINALYRNTAGHNNIAVGFNAGVNLTTGNNDIYVGSGGAAATEGNTTRIGTQGTQTAAYIAGIFGSVVTGDAVVVNSTGRLGIVMSSAWYKRDIEEMGERSQGLLKLRPVTFRYKQDPQGDRQYVLIAEEVAQVYPELVGYASDGKVQTVRYHELIPMLLNELQKQSRQVQQLTEESERDAAENRRLSTQVAQLKGMFEHEMAAQKRTGA